MGSLNIPHATLIVNTASMIAACVMLFLVYRQTQKAQEWNRRKTSEETLNRLVMGEFYSLLNKLTTLYEWDPVNQQKDYVQITSELKNNKEDIKNIQITIRSILRILEAVCINIKHNMIDEEVCYDYMYSILINIYRKNIEFIKRERDMRNNPHVFEYVEYYAKKWEQKSMSSDYINNEQHKKRLFFNRKDKL
jgi:hypothetical protein